MARADPKRVLASSPGLLHKARLLNDTESEVVLLRALGGAARSAGRTDESIAHLANAVEIAESAALKEQARAARITAASSLFIAGRQTDALRSLDLAQKGASATVRARIDFQRATIFSRSGRSDLAERYLGRALPVFEATGDERRQAMVHHNLGMLSIYAGNADLASTRLRRARDLFDKLGDSIQVAYLDHSLGMAASYRGDVAEALRLFDESEQAIDALGGDVAEVQVARCETLLSAGLFADAERLAYAASERMEKAGELVDQAEIILVAAEAGLLRGANDRAVRAAAQAIRILSVQDRPGWMATAQQLHLRAKAARSQPSAELCEAARDLVPKLSAAGQYVPAAHMTLLAGRLAIEVGDLNGARRDLLSIPTSTGPIELRVGSWLARALLREGSGDRAGALRAARAGLGVLEKYQSAVGATDVRAGLAKHGRELAELGLNAAIASGRPRTVFSWMELGHSRALLRRPLQPSADDKLARELAELRRASAQLRRVVPSELAAAIRRQTRIQNQIRRHTHGQAGSTSPDVGLATVDQLINALDGRSLVSFGAGQNSMWSVVLFGRRARLHDLGPVERAVRNATDLRRALDRATQPRSGGSSAVDSANGLAREVDAQILGPQTLGTGPVAISVPPALSVQPWGLLPSLFDRPFSVTPSATSWLNGQGPASTGPAVVAAGPGLRHASEELKRVAGLYPGAKRFPASRSTVSGVLEALESAAIAHIACHGRFNAEQPLFSTLSLANGDLTLLDLHGLKTPPAVVILSACEAGLSGQDPGDELLALTGSLLSMGSRAVVAATVAVPDSPVMPRLMTRFHKRLLAGDTVAEALAFLRTTAKGDHERLASSSFVCFGNGETVVRVSSTRS